MSKSKKPRAGHVWFDNDSLSRDVETILLLRIVVGLLVPGVSAWQLLVTRKNGTTYLDAESLDIVYDWYTASGSGESFARIV